MGIVICDRIIMFFLGLMIFFLPISKAVIEVSASICIFAWIAKRLILLNIKNKPYKNMPSFFNISSLNKALILFIGVNLISALFSSNIRLSMNTFFFKLLEYILIFIVVRDTVKSKLRYKTIIWVILSSLLFMGLDGIFQIVTGNDLFRHRGLWIYRVTASFENPNDFGTYLITIIPVALSLIFVALDGKIKSFLVIASVVALSALAFTVSKGAWLALLPSIIFFGLYTRKRYALLIIAGISLLVLILPLFFKFSLLNLLQRLLFRSNDPGILERKFLWVAALRMFIHKPFFGVGLGTFMENYQRFWIRPTTEIAYAHNCYLQTLAETGIIGLSAFMLFLCVWFTKTIKILSRPYKSEDTFVYFSFLGLTVGLLAYLLNSFVDTNLYSLTIAVLFWFILGLQVGGAKILNEGKISN